LVRCKTNRCQNCPEKNLSRRHGVPQAKFGVRYNASWFSTEFIEEHDDEDNDEHSAEATPDKRDYVTKDNIGMISGLTTSSARKPMAIAS